LIGRERDLTRLLELVEAHRIVSVTGPPGIGKTRLALEIAEGEKAVVADLTACRTRADAVAEIARALGLSLENDPDPRERVARALSARGGLVLLDNAEHVIEDIAPLVVRWLELGVRVLVTSREQLRVEGEEVLELGPLSLPDPAETDPAIIEKTEAYQLLAARARGFTVDAGNAPVLARLLHELDGIPLAVELAASRLGTLGVSELYERLHRRLDLLAQSTRGSEKSAITLRGALDGSWELLTEDERAAFAASSVFQGGFDLEAGEAVLGAAAIELLQSLREKHLVRAIRTGDSIRFDLFASIRAYAAEKREDDSVGDRHAEFYARLVRDADDTVLFRESENVLAAQELSRKKEWARDRIDAAVALALAADRVLSRRGHTERRMQLLETALAAIPERAKAPLLQALGRALSRAGRADQGLAHLRNALTLATDDAERAELLADAGEALQTQGRLAEARADYERAISIAGPLAKRARARTLRGLGLLHHSQGELEEARACYEEALALARSLGDRSRTAELFTDLGSLNLQRGRLDEARDHYRRALEIHEANPDPLLVGLVEGNLGILEQELGRLDVAREHYERGLRALERAGAHVFRAHLLGYLGGLCHESRDLDRATELYAEAAMTLRAIGDRRLEGVFTAARGCAEAMRDRIEAAEEAFETASKALETIGDEGLLLALRVHRASVLLAAARLSAQRGDADAAARDRALAAAALAAAEQEEALLRSSDDARFAARLLTHALRSSTLVVRDGAGELVLPDGTKIELRTREPLRRMVLALALRRQTDPGAPIAAEDLLAEGWPGERIQAEAGMNRVKVALSTLRKLGLRDLLVRSEGGYFFDPAVPLLFEE
jgi:predicted ATPase